VRRFLRDVRPATSDTAAGADALAEAAGNALTLKYLDGGHGDGCPNEDDAYTLARRRMHHFTFYGFMLCFAATSVATIYHYVFGWHAPYDLPSLPKLLGVVGGVSLLIGTVGLWRLNRRRDPAHGDAAQKPMDLGFIALLALIAASGLGLWMARVVPGHSVMVLLLCLHLGAVMALFITLPYGKFAHGIYRAAALVRYATEKRRPNPVALGAD
jgi:citrate/tricarballylate utilization protein